MPTDRGLALALLLPALVVLAVWPLAVGVGDPLPLATAAGLAALAALPAALLSVWRGAGIGMGLLPLFVLMGLCALAAVRSGAATDSFERDGALANLAVFALGILAGGSLGDLGRRVLAIGTAALALVALLPTFVAEHGGGVLGNTGTLAQVALPGAAAGLGLVVLGRGALVRGLGGAAFLAAVLHAQGAPVWTTLVALLFAALVLIVRATAVAPSPGAQPVPRVPLVLALLALGLAAAPRLVPMDGATAPVPTASSAELGGVDARLAIWTSLPPMVAALPWHGAGPGQFQSQYPPHRAPGEITISSVGRDLPFETEVEHPHNDYLRALVELGPVGGAAFGALLLLALVACVRAVLSPSASGAALGLAGIAVCVNAAAHSPIFGNGASASLAGAVLGAALAAARSRAIVQTPPLRSVPAWILLVLLLALAPRVASLMQHGRAFLERARALDEGTAALEEAERAAPAQAALAAEQARIAGARAAAALQRALFARADSPVALGLLAREELARGDTDRARGHNEALLALRPHQIEALVRRGLLAVRAGDYLAARAAWERCIVLDEWHPTANTNLLRLELQHMDPIRAEAHASRLQGGALDGDTVVRVVADGALGGWIGPEVLERVLIASGAFEPTGLPEALFAAAQGLFVAADELPADRAGPTSLQAAGLEALAHSLWAEQHLEGGDLQSARRSLRQALRASRAQGRPGSPRVALELAAVEVELGEQTRAAALLVETPPTPRALEGMAPSRLEGLRSAGLLPPN